jgi:hypothetical protein
MLVASSGYLVLAAVLGFSGAIKLRHPGALARQIGNYQIIPSAMAGYAGAVLAVTETGCAVLLLLPPARRAGLVIAGSMIAVFLAAMSLSLARGRHIPCACFGGAGELDNVGPASLTRTALLGAIAVLALVTPPTAMGPAQVLVAALLLVLVFLLAETARLVPRRPVPRVGR